MLIDTFDFNHEIHYTIKPNQKDQTQYNLGSVNYTLKSKNEICPQEFYQDYCQEQNSEHETFTPRDLDIITEELIKPQQLFNLYCARLGSEDLDFARQSQIEASVARALQEEHHSQFGKGDDKDRFDKVAASPSLQNQTARSVDESNTQHQILIELNKVIETTNEPINKNKIKEIQTNLNTISSIYLNSSGISNYHSFKSISKNLDGLDENDRIIVLSELVEFRDLIRSIISFKKYSKNFLKNIESISFDERQVKHLIELFQQLIHKIAATRKAALHIFCTSSPEKNTLDAQLQTISSIYVSEINKVEQNLKVMIEHLEIRFSLKPSSPALLKNKKVMIFTCSYGTGHKITASAIAQALRLEKAEAPIYDLSTGALLGRDRYRYIFRNLGIDYNDHPLNGVDIFNEILKNQLYFVVNTKDNVDLFIRKFLNISGKDGVTSPAGLLNNSWEKTQVRELLQLENPDHIITTYHMDLNPILEVAEELGIPVLHVPTDYSMKFWETFDKKAPSHPYFKSLLPNHAVEKTLETRYPLSFEHFVEGVGIPLRQEFYSCLSPEAVLVYRESRGIKEHEKVLFLSSGGNGQILPHPEYLANSQTWKIPLRVEVVAGKNRDYVKYLQSHLEAQQDHPYILHGSNPYVSIEIVVNPDLSKQGTEEEFFIPPIELSKLLDITDMSIAKAGGLSVAELLFKGVPILFDQRLTPFSWEQFNSDTAIFYNMGVSNFSLRDLEHDMKCVLEIPKSRNEHFYFENSHKNLTEAIQTQIKSVESDNEMMQRRGLLYSTQKRASHTNNYTQYYSHEQAATAVSKTPNIASLAARDLIEMTNQELDENWKLNEYFGEIKIITSDVKGPRFQRCQQELNSIGLYEGTYTIFSGVDGTTLDKTLWLRAENWDPNDTNRKKQGRMGCLMAHYLAIKDTVERLQAAQEYLNKLRDDPNTTIETILEAEEEVNKYRSVLIIEDNTGFGRVSGEHSATLKGFGKKLRNTLKDLPEDWDMFYLIAMADDWGTSQLISENLLKLNYGVLTKCYAVSAKMYSPILDHFENLLQSNKKIYPVDHVLAMLQKYYKCYAPKDEALCYRFGSVSEVQTSDISTQIINWQPSIRCYGQ